MASKPDHRAEAMRYLEHDWVASMLTKSTAGHAVLAPIMLQVATVHALLHLADQVGELRQAWDRS